LLSPLLLNIVLEILARAIGQEKEIKAVQIGKGKSKTIFSDDRFYVENSTESTKVTVRINKLNKVAGYKISTQKISVSVH